MAGIDYYDFQKASGSLGAISFNIFKNRNPEIPEGTKTGFAKTVSNITESFKAGVAEQTAKRAEDPEAFDRAVEERRQLALARTEAQRIVAAIDAAKKQQQDAKGIFKSERKKAEAMHAMGQALSNFNMFIKAHENKPYYPEVYPILKPYMNAEAQAKAENKILEQEILEANKSVNAGIGDQLKALGIKPEYLAYGVGGLVAFRMIKALAKNKKKPAQL